ncbi:uncharacterized protein [Blastocystis hominis]|uniref:T-complex protein 1 subunit zeta n=1 Tax=Blastocystis hominis TaxID=12968 RepID=D8LXT9_BLAHO|nr:uncharacterized protein [Blastocystis hominis]XP_012899272.1 uncharacterized protein [Blastocystis hominis]CBK20394.2 unnamed protein product [Blastocystis hominis]CBK25224.2 unnamed protein product [Blastocystis hominis]|eukprot:XP_012894442.1 uncharacterized protein [Blastocystis hominis]
MSSLNLLNPKAEYIKKQQAMAVQITAASGMQEVLKTNLGPKGTMKMLVGSSGQIKLTKDGNVLLHEMQIQHPTASLIARTATAQDDITGDGTTSTVLFIGELMKVAARYVNEGVHPRLLTDGFEIAKTECLRFLDTFAEPIEDIENDHELLYSVARTSLRTKLEETLADHLTEMVTDAVLTVKRPGKPLDILMIEQMEMITKDALDSRLVKGLVLDHGARHPDMPKSLKNCYVLILNVSLEYEKSETNASFVYSTAQERDELVAAERKFTDDKVRKIIDFKNTLCPPDGDRSFVVINQKGIDPLSLDMLAKANILALRRAKRRNMERLSLACGGIPMNSVDDLSPAVLGFAGHVYEQTVGEDKFCFVEDVRNPFSCTLLLQGPNQQVVAQLKDAARDGIRAVKNALEDGRLVPGAGAFELAAYEDLMKMAGTVEGKAKLGVRAFAEALLVIPKTLAENSGFDVMDTILEVQEEIQKSGMKGGIDVVTGKVMLPSMEGVWDNYRVKRQFIQLSTVIASQLLLVDEVMSAGRNMGAQSQAPAEED